MNQILKITELFTAVLSRELDDPEKEGLVSINCDHRGAVSVHVMEEYFEEHFSHYECIEVAQPRHDKIRISFETDAGNEVFCLKKALFGVVA